MRLAFWKSPPPPPPPAPRRAAVPPEVLRNIRRIEIRVRRLVNTVFLGEYHTVFKGRGIEFAEVREYDPADDSRQIDWNVTARMGAPYVKKYQEERELSVFLVVDISGSGAFGSVRVKQEVAAEVCAVLAFAAIRNDDKVGLLTFTDAVETFLPPRKGRENVLRVVRELLAERSGDGKTDIGAALRYLGHLVKRRCVVFLVSDFQAEGYESALRVLARRHDVVAVTITDPRELTLPPVGLVALQDAETGEEVLVDAASPQVRRSFAEQAAARVEARTRLFRSVGVDHIDISTGRSYVQPLITFFKMRERRE
ncbi:MAG: DUF58 domain-containing protein [Chloroflexi bacterium]|nr:DUF58 domain-containing protein [Chloroflexota bacterium]